MKLFNNRTTAVAAGATILVLAGAGGAVAAGQITGRDIKDGSIYSRDIHDGSIYSRDIHNGTLHSWDFSAQATRSLRKYDGPNWSIIDRNTIGNGDAYLRAGPSYVDSSGNTVKPPLGVGSLGLRTGSTQDKADFGDQVDFAGKKVSSLQTLKYSIFTTGENNDVSPGNLPNLTFEINPHLVNNGQPVNYTSMVYQPASQNPGWTAHNAGEDTTNTNSSGWYFTGQAGALTGCNQTTYCTLSDAKAKVPNGTILTAGISKGRDNPFSGAVDALVVNRTTYDFEPFGVTARTS